MFKAFKEKTAELKDKAKQRMSMANEQGRRLRENVEVMTGVDKARERFAQARNPIGGSSTAARLGGFSGAATAATSLSNAFSKIGSSPYKSAAAAKSHPDAEAARLERVAEETKPRDAAAEGDASAAGDAVLAALEPGYYLPEEDFDPVRHVLQSIAANKGELTTDVLHIEEEQLSNVVEVV